MCKPRDRSRQFLRKKRQLRLFHCIRCPGSCLRRAKAFPCVKPSYLRQKVLDGMILKLRFSRKRDEFVSCPRSLILLSYVRFRGLRAADNILKLHQPIRWRRKVGPMEPHPKSTTLEQYNCLASVICCSSVENLGCGSMGPTFFLHRIG